MTLLWCSLSVLAILIAGAQSLDFAATDIVKSLLYTSGHNASEIDAHARTVDPEVYLKLYGYLETKPQGKDASEIDIEERDREFSEALREFQKRAGVEQSGIMDDATKDAMLAPRCGVKDLGELGRSSKFKWKSNKLTWKLTGKTNQLQEGFQRQAMGDALKLWSEVTPLEFSEVNPASPADITIVFGKSDHGDAYPFDGQGSVLAHAFYPQDGRCHFDDDESWVYKDEEKSRQYQYKDLVKVAVHELGHVLGLSHSKDFSAIMGAIYRHYQPDEEATAKLTQDDIVRIQDLYGASPSGNGGPDPRPPTVPVEAELTRPPTPRIIPTSPPRAPPPRLPSQCPWSNIDTVFAEPGPAGKLYILQSDNYWVYDSSRLDRQIGSVPERFPGGPRNIKHAVSGRGGQIYLMSDTQVWAYTYMPGPDRFELIRDYPKALAPDIVGFRPDLVIRWTDGNIIFIKDGNFKIYDFGRSTITFQGLSSNYFPGIPEAATDGFLDKDGILQFYIEDGIHEYDTRSKSLGPPTNVEEFFACGIAPRLISP